MKTSPLPKLHQSGVALVIVLAMLVLITALVMAFFSSVTTDFSSSRAYANGENAKQLADSAVNVVMAQIKDATAGFVTDSTGTPDTSKRLAWASQPGMIRTWDDSGNAYKVFKLYSSDNMSLAGGAFDPSTDQADLASGAWKTEPAIYTDLNSPVLIRDDANGTIVPDASKPEKYIASAPIIDPNNLVSVSVNGVDKLTYQTGATPDIEGFSVTPPPATVYDGIPANISPTNNPVPMPVKWVYVLRDGTLAPATMGTNGSTAKVAAATAGNPIVGRIAFWADDETCKVNINTASEGTFWDVPLVWNYEEYGTGNDSSKLGFAHAMPASAEFQRTPGHPATTSLSTVFGAKLALPTLPLTESGYDTYLAPYYMLTPRYTPGGSKGGTRPAWKSANLTGTNDETQLKSSNFRLFTSVDEFLFDPNRKALTAADSGLYPTNLGALPSTDRPAMALGPDTVRESRFFITANSRAPEVTLFNSPRISLWPLQADTTCRNSKDALLAFCSTIGDPTNANNRYPYYFQRATTFQTTPASGGGTGNNADVPGSSQSSTTDFPGAPSSSPAAGVGRNRNLYSYLQNLTGNPVPGFGGNFLSKYPGAGGHSDRDQILTEMFDYIRSGVNTLSISLFPKYTFTPYKTDGNFSMMGAGSSVPIVINGTKGLGRMITLKEVALVFYCTKFLDETNLNPNPNYQDPSSAPYPNWPFPNKNAYIDTYGPLHALYVANGNAVPQYLPTTVSKDAISGKVLFPAYPPNTPVPDSDGLPDDVADDSGKYDGIGDPQTTGMRCVVIFQPYSLMAGYPYYTSNVRYQFSGLENLSVTFAGNSTATSLGFPSGNNAWVFGSSPNASSSSPIGSFYEIYGFLANTNCRLITDSTDALHTVPERNGLLNNGSITNQNSYDFSGANLNRRIYPLISAPITIPAFDASAGINVPVPNASRWGGAPATYTGAPLSDTDAIKAGQQDLRPLAATSTFSLNGADIVVKIVSAYGADPLMAEQIQTINVHIPSMNNVPVPTLEMANVTDWHDSNMEAPSCGSGVVPSDAAYVKNPQDLRYYYRLPYDRRDYQQRFMSGANWPNFFNIWRLVCRGDTTRSIQPNPLSKYGADLRIIGALQTVPKTAPGDGQYAYTGAGDFNNPNVRNIHCLRYDLGNVTFYSPFRNAATPTTSPSPYPPVLWEISEGGYDTRQTSDFGGRLVANQLYNNGSGPTVSLDLNGAYMDPSSRSLAGDYSNGIGVSADGPFVIKGDEGAQCTPTDGYSVFYYMTAGGNVDSSSKFAMASFSPNRQVASAVMFGTLPARVQDPQPWRTLLFCPNPSAGADHPGFGQGSGSSPGPSDKPPYTLPPDHLLLDLFWMPVVEPYAISEPFSTAGKVNMNYQIVPFSNIRRDTAVRAVMKSTRVFAVPTTATNPARQSWAYDPSSGKANYKTTTGGANDPQNGGANYRYDINLDETSGTLRGFEDRFATGDIFRSASEICNIFLVPQKRTGSTYVGAGTTPPSSYAQTQSWWDNFKLTGDNGRESPYNQIYPRLTTKSNTFQVHYRVQLLAKRVGSDPALWEEGKDQVAGEYRGSTILERYIDPNDSRLANVDFATLSLSDPAAVIDKYYRFRIVSTKAFTP